MKLKMKMERLRFIQTHWTNHLTVPDSQLLTKTTVCSTTSSSTGRTSIRSVHSVNSSFRQSVCRSTSTLDSFDGQNCLFGESVFNQRHILLAYFFWATNQRQRQEQLGMTPQAGATMPLRQDVPEGRQYLRVKRRSSAPMLSKNKLLKLLGN